MIGWQENILLLALRGIAVSFFTYRFDETYSHIRMRNLEDRIEWIGYTVNDLDNAISEIDYNSPMIFFEIAKEMRKVIKEEKKE